MKKLLYILLLLPVCVFAQQDSTHNIKDTSSFKIILSGKYSNGSKAEIEDLYKDPFIRVFMGKTPLTVVSFGISIQRGKAAGAYLKTKGNKLTPQMLEQISDYAINGSVSFPITYIQGGETIASDGIIVYIKHGE